MKITIESTTRVVEVTDGVHASVIKARVWEGTTESGIRVQCLIPRISAHKDEDLSQFERELVQQKEPTPAALVCFPLRMVL